MPEVYTVDEEALERLLGRPVSDEERATLRGESPDDEPRWIDDPTISEVVMYWQKATTEHYGKSFSVEKLADRLGVSPVEIRGRALAGSLRELHLEDLLRESETEDNCEASYMVGRGLESITPR